MGEWRSYTLAELAAQDKHALATGPFGSAIASRNFQDSGVPVIRGANLSLNVAERLRDDDLVFISEAKAEEFQRSVASRGDLVFTCWGTIGQIGLIDERARYGRYVVSNKQMKLTPNLNLVDPLFAYYALSAPQMVSQVQGASIGSSVPGFNLTQLRSISVMVPPLGEQHEIAEVLGALDDKIALNERIRHTALSLAGACYESVGTGNEPEVLGDLAELFDGPHATPHKTPTGPWFLSISSLKSGYLDLAESAHLSEEDFPRWTRRVQPQGGDVLFSYETRLGDAALMPPGVRGSLGRRMALLRSKSAAVSGPLLLHAYLAPAFQEEIKRRTIHGATVDRLPLKEMPGWRISLPAEGERERLSEKLEALHTTVMQTADENRTLADLRDTLLPQLVTGKLRVKDATRVVEEAV
ncbi:restriction endonuclease subunit S [Streptomyces sp. NPDC006175]|uniref:restriction endonuclease subunit S n=1 Tax=Streptomyces sp. NPDC006175 TaxID=3154471 RepID=UPI0033BDB4B1